MGKHSHARGRVWDEPRPDELWPWCPRHHEEAVQRGALIRRERELRRAEVAQPQDSPDPHGQRPQGVREAAHARLEGRRRRTLRATRRS
jgi:hypothetical protein